MPSGLAAHEEKPFTHHVTKSPRHVSERMSERYAQLAVSEFDDVLHRIWVSGPGAAGPGELLSQGVTPLPSGQAQALTLPLCAIS